MSALLSGDGPFARQLPDFETREVQVRMEQAVTDAIARRGTLVVEAATGTGKTYAYLAPALLSGSKVVVSTGTRNLQDQLFFRDLPAVDAILATGAHRALLKGRTNYLCLYRFEQTLSQPELLPDAAAGLLHTIQVAVARTGDGDLDRIPGMDPEPVRGRITANADNCLGAECPYFDDCHVYRARRRALEADIVVINHHLFFADFALREGGGGEIVPDCDLVIFDEAHQLPDIATRFLGQSISSAQLQELCGDLALELQESGVSDRTASLAGDQLMAEIAELNKRIRLTGQGGHSAQPQDTDDPMIDAAGRTLERLGDLQGALEPLAGESLGLENCLDRSRLFYERIETFLAASEETTVRWYEQHARSVTLHTAPLDVATLLRERLYPAGRGMIFTSATLSVAGSFAHFNGRMGLDGPDELLLDSPFDVARNALLFVPPNLPDPGSRDFTAAAVEAVRPILRATRGRAFYLFTSHAALRRAARLLEGEPDLTLLVQGSAPRTRLLSAFLETPGAVLLGTSSFWQGVDVPGAALSCVIIEKLPFAVPDDPLVAARARAVKAAGNNPFMTLQVPEAALLLKQGAGRLLRSASDRGLLVIADPRLLSRHYGKIFRASLPAMPLTRELDQALTFIATHIPALTA